MHCHACGFATSAVLYRCGHCDALLPPPPGLSSSRPAEAAVPVRDIHLSDGLGQVVIAAIWLVALLEAGTLTMLAFAVTQWTGPDVDATPMSIVDSAASWAVALWTLAVAEAMTGLVFVAWLARARASLDGLGGTPPQWGRWWTVWCWVVPVANLILVPTVVADVARGSADSLAGSQGRALARLVWTWWLLYLGRPLLTWAGFVGAAPLLVDALRWSDPRVVGVVAAAVPGGVVCVVAALLAGRVVGGVCREQRQRAQRLSAPSAGGVVRTAAMPRR